MARWPLTRSLYLGHPQEQWRVVSGKRRVEIRPSHGQCADLLDRCQREELTGLTLHETINETTHRLMVAEAKAKGVIASGGARALRRSFRLIPTLRGY